VKVPDMLNRLTDARVAELNEHAIVMNRAVGKAWVGNIRTGEMTTWSAFGRASIEQRMWLNDPRARKFENLDAFLAFVARGCVGEPDGFDRTDPEVAAFLIRAATHREESNNG
jgi:hypothetical protein